MPSEPRFPRLKFLAPCAALLLTLLLIAACGVDEPSTPSSPPAPVSNSGVTTATTAAPPETQEPTAAPITVVSPTPEPTEEPVQTVSPESNDDPATPAPPATEAAESEPEATTAAPAPAATEIAVSGAGPTASPPSATEPATEPVAPELVEGPEPCEGNRGGAVGDCAPEFAGTQEWINSQPFSMGSQLGKVVLIDFWTYSCINCIRTFPFLREWYDRYADEGLIIVGVHTPEFEFEKVFDNVVEATVDMGVAWPVVQDNDFTVWRSYNNRFWPAKYLIDKDGVIRYRHFGEGRYAETEEEIRKLLAEIGAESEVLSQPLPEDQQNDLSFLTSSVQRTPELFAGWRFTSLQQRGGIGQVDTYMEAARASYTAGEQKGVVAEFVQPRGKLEPNLIYFHGPWIIGPESATHARNTDSYIDAIILHYSARSVNAVLTSESGEPYKVIVTVNNEYLTEESKGEDIIIGENGESYILIDSPRAYYLVEHPEWQEGQILALSSMSDDFGLFSFTFGTYEDGF